MNPEENSKDTDGDDIAEDVPYKIFVLSMADGIIANYNSLSCESNEITISINTVIHDNSLHEISIYPNPSRGILNLTGFGNPLVLGLKISDNAGRTIFQSEDENRSQYSKSSIQIDLSHFEKGIYLFQIKTRSEIYTEKLIIQ